MVSGFAESVDREAIPVAGRLRHSIPPRHASKPPLAYILQNASSLEFFNLTSLTLRTPAISRLIFAIVVHLAYGTLYLHSVPLGQNTTTKITLTDANLPAFVYLPPLLLTFTSSPHTK